MRRLNADDAPRMQAIVAMLPEPRWRDENVPSFAHLARALGDPAVYVFAAFEAGRPAGFVSAYRFPSLTKACDLVYIYDVYVAPLTRTAAWAGVSWTASSPNAGRTGSPRRGLARIWNMSSSSSTSRPYAKKDVK